MEEVNENNVVEKQENMGNNSTFAMDKFLISSIRKNFAIAAPYQALIGGILIIIAWAILNPLNGLDLMYPYFHIPFLPFYRTVGTIIIVIAGFQLLFSVLFQQIYKWNSKICLLLSKIFASLMIIILPTGTYFGILIWQDIVDLENISIMKKKDNKDFEKKELTLKEKLQKIKQTMIASGLLMLHMPIFLFILFYRIITFPIDMAYPVLAAKATNLWGMISWIILIGYLLQIILGFLITRIQNKSIIKITLAIFAIFQIIALGIFIQGFLTISASALGLVGASSIIIYFSWIFGVLLNPIGVHFGISIWRQSQNLKD